MGESKCFIFPHCALYTAFVEVKKISQKFSEKFCEIKRFSMYKVNCFHGISLSPKRYFVKLTQYQLIFGETAQCGNYGNSLSLIFGKNSVKVTVLLNRFDLTKIW